MYKMETMLYNFLREEELPTSEPTEPIESNNEEETESEPNTEEEEEEVSFEDDDTGLGNSEEDSRPIFNLIPLKKLFIRLILIEKLIRKINDPNLKKTKIYVNDSIELIKIISNNIDIYVDDLKKITKMYENFILDILSDIKKSVSKTDGRKNK